MNRASNSRLESAKHKAHMLLREERDKRKRDLLNDLIDDINAGIWVNEQRLTDMEMWSIRNPGFPGDMIGRPDDDFFDDDEDDDEGNEDGDEDGDEKDEDEDE